jgi:hypothetical protein
MFNRKDVLLISNPQCLNAVDDLSSEDFQYYDKDGFELNSAEQKFYRTMGYPINYPILNHICWQEPWFELKDNGQGLVLDHSMFLCRAAYNGEARRQLEEFKSHTPQADLLLRTRIKWGYDFALDAVRDGEVFEVLHIEYDNTDYQTFTDSMIKFEWMVRHRDWSDAADSIWIQRDSWQHLTGFDQNHWKAKYLLGWERSEYTEKST